MQKNEEYMMAAIEAAKAALADGGVAIGSVLVDPDGKIFSSGGSIVGITHDPTARAEINCIRAACRSLGSEDLFGFTLYSTLEPCHMCLSAASWAKIQTIFFGAYRKDVDETLFDIKGSFSDEREAARMNLREALRMQVHGGVLEEQCAELLASHSELARHTTEKLSA